MFTIKFSFFALLSLTSALLLHRYIVADYTGKSILYFHHTKRTVAVLLSAFKSSFSTEQLNTLSSGYHKSLSL